MEEPPKSNILAGFFAIASLIFVFVFLLLTILQSAASTYLALAPYSEGQTIIAACNTREEPITLEYKGKTVNSIIIVDEPLEHILANITSVKIGGRPVTGYALASEEECAIGGHGLVVVLRLELGDTG